ncbi:MAG: DUF7525 family protein [Halanaeroarchaeum sp.]
MASTTSDSATDIDTGFGILFGLLAAASAGVVLFVEGLPRSLGFGAAVVFGILLIVSLHVYR